MSIKYGERIVLFGAGDFGHQAARLLRFEKDVLYIVDNDLSISGGQIEGIEIFSPRHLLEDRSYERVVITTAHYAGIVRHLENMGITNYVYMMDLYGWQLDCESRRLMDRHVPERSVGQYVGRMVKNAWMNHLEFHYKRNLLQDNVTDGCKALDVGCGCGTSLFWLLLMGYDAYGLDCCDWKLDFCRQKIKDFNFPIKWQERFLYGYGEQLPFSDNEFSLILCWYVLEHVQDWKKCLAEMIRVLQPGGMILLNAPDYRNSYEEHYGIDIGMSIVDNQDVLKNAVIEAHESLDTFEELNFLTKNDVLSELQKYANLKIQDRDELFPDVQRKDGKLINHRRIDFVIRKL